MFDTARRLVAGVLLGCVSLTASAQTVQPVILHSFAAVPQNPTLVYPSTNGFYGTTSSGGTNGGFGTFFQISTNGTFAILASFHSSNAAPSGVIAPIFDDLGNLPSPLEGFYGVSVRGGNGYGTIYKINTNAFTGFSSGPTNWTVTTEATFGFTNTPDILFGGDDADLNLFGVNPYGGMVSVSGLTSFSYCGTTYAGGSNGLGAIFGTKSVGQAGSRFDIIASFNGTNGANPYGPLIKGFGTTVNGGAHGYGTVFSFTTNGGITTLVSFDLTNGANPTGGLIAANLVGGATIYGTTSNGGMYGYGTVFSLRGTTFKTLASFADTNGANPSGTVYVDNAGNVYGTTVNGGANGGFGTIFKLTSAGVLTTLYSFSGSDGAYPLGSLLLGGDGLLYGTTSTGGSNNGCGTIFRITTNGVFTSLVSFSNSAGANPYSPLLQGADGSLYGTTSLGGTAGAGTLYQITTNGNFTPLVSFAGTNGANPYAGLVQTPDGTLWGTTCAGGTNGNYGTIFQSTTNGLLASLLSFNGGDGANPCAGLTLGMDGNFYGTTLAGGSNGCGTVFQFTPAGVLTSLFSFNQTSGAAPYAGLALGADGNFYGTTLVGGTSNYGTVFRITPAGAFTLITSLTIDDDKAYGTLMLDTHGNLYGTTLYDDQTINKFPVNLIGGTVFDVTTNDVFASVFSFDNTVGSVSRGALALGSDGKFYMTTSLGAGTVASISGTTASLVAKFSFTNGAAPFAGLIQASNGNFYGTTAAGGPGGGGTVFQLSSYPAITTPPGNPTAQCGGNATFSVTASAVMTPFTYQWFLNNSPLSNGLGVSGANSSSLTLSGVTLSDTGESYSVVVSNFIGSATSPAGVLTVIDTAPPLITLDGLSPTNVALNSVYDDAGATANDSCAGPVPVTSNNLVNTAVAGTYTVTYMATDPSGNTGTRIRAVNVLAPAPVQFGPAPDPNAFSFPTVSGQSYTIQQSTNLSSGMWCFYTNLIGTGNPWEFFLPIDQSCGQFFRVSEP